MKERLGYRYRIYPDARQARLFRQTVGCCRLVYNLCLEQRSMACAMPSRHRLSSFDQIKELPGLKAHLPFLKDVPNHCLQQAAVDLDKAFKNFFKGHAAYPKARRKFQNESFRFPDPKQISFGEKGILLPKAGWVKLVLHRPFLGEVKNVTVSADGDHWYVAVQTEREVDEPASVLDLPDLVELGGDLGVVNALALSDGTVYDLPRMTEKEKRREANLARRVSRRSRGSKNRLRAQRDLRRFRARIVRRRRDAKHKMTTDVVSRCDVLYLEDLKLKNMTASAKGTVEEPGTNVAQKSGLNRAILDVSPGATRLQFEYKMRRRGGAVFYVNPARTSQRCAECGHVDPKNRIDRDRFECVRCGHAACADHNAGRNILHLGRKARTGGHPGMACGSNLAGGRKQEEDGSSQVAQAA
ncbi:RNA-guided endonuclease InsQ/TnpB family protein [Rhizobium sullae]|nr:RNA-guided endonuclease TnpB family protein [Rhizobium sullae]